MASLQDWKKGDVVIIASRGAVVTWNGLPKFRVAKVRWQDSGEVALIHVNHISVPDAHRSNEDLIVRVTFALQLPLPFQFPGFRCFFLLPTLMIALGRLSAFVLSLVAVSLA